MTVDNGSLRRGNTKNSRTTKSLQPLKKFRDFKRFYLAPFYLNPTVQRWMIGVTSAIILALLLSPAIQLPSEHYQVGDVASADIKSTQDFLVEDENATLTKRIEAENWRNSSGLPSPLGSSTS
jgi:hypothetical protein